MIRTDILRGHSGTQIRRAEGETAPTQESARTDASECQWRAHSRGTQAVGDPAPGWTSPPGRTIHRAGAIGRHSAASPARRAVATEHTRRATGHNTRPMGAQAKIRYRDPLNHACARCCRVLRYSPLSLPHDEHRTGRMLHDSGRYAAQKESSDGAQPFGACDDQVGLVCF